MCSPAPSKGEALAEAGGMEGTLSEGVKLLKLFQGWTKLNDSGFARALGINKALLSRIYSGKCQMGLKVWRSLLIYFPDDEHMIAHVLAGGSLDAVR
jgi:hypothetical protein